MNPLEVPPGPEVIDLLKGLECPPPEKNPEILKEPERIPPAAVDCMLQLGYEDIKNPPQKKTPVDREHQTANMRALHSRKRHAMGRKNRPIAVAFNKPGDVALWLALGHSNDVIAERLQCSVHRLRIWLGEFPAVRVAAKEIRKQLLDRVEGSVVDLAGKAVVKLGDLMENSKVEEIQMRSAKILLDKAFELRPEKKAALVEINNAAPSLDLSQIPSKKLKLILEEELAARAEPAGPEKAREGPQPPPGGPPRPSIDPLDETE